MPIKKNDIIRVKIDDFTSEGYGVAKSDSMVIFVKEAAPLEILDVKILKVKKNYAFAKIENIIERSNCRIDPDCSVYSKCGGCTFRHISYESELKLKQKRVKDALERIGGFKNLNITDIVAADNYNFYRNKAQTPVGLSSDNKELIMGFYANHSHRIIDCTDCKLHQKDFKTALDIIHNWIITTKQQPYDETSRLGTIRHVYLRMACKTNQLMVCIVANAESLKGEELLVNLLKDGLPNLKSVMLNVNTKNTNVVLGDKYRKLYGEDYIIDELCGLKFKISAESFYQVNRDQAEKLYNIAKKYACLDENDIVLDLYCGTGTIGLTMAKDIKNLIGVEIVKKAIDNAKENAKLNNINNASFICGDASDSVKKIIKDKYNPNIIILDPPRKGCDKNLIETVLEINPDKIVYISCDPGTLARDLKVLHNNYNIDIVTPVDMFPRTAHVECVVLLNRANNI